MLNKTFIITLYILTIALFAFFLYGTRSIPTINVSLKIENVSPEANGLKISKDSLTELNSQLTKFSGALPEEKLMRIFEREREHYILLISILLGLTTIIALYFTMTRLVEKQEFDKIRTELTALSGSLKEDLDAVKMEIVRLNLAERTEDYRSETIFHTKAGQPVDGADAFLLYVDMDITMLSERVSPHFEKAPSNWSLLFENLVAAMLYYAKKEGYAPNQDYDVDTNPPFKAIISAFYRTLPAKAYMSLIGNIQKGNAAAKLGIFGSRGD